MKFLFAFLACLALVACSIGENASKAEASVRQFHASLNDGKLAEIVSNSAPEIKGEPKFGKLLEVVRRKLGRVVSSKQVGWNENMNTSGQFVTLNYETKFEKGDGVESFVFKVLDGRLVLAGWHINSDALIMS